MADDLEALVEERIDRFESSVIVALRKVTAGIARKLGLVITADADPAAISVDDLANINGEWSAAVDGALSQELAGIFVAATETVPIAADSTGALFSVEAAQAATALTAETYQSAAANRMYGIGQELWTNARNALLEGMQAGEGIPKIQKRVKDAVGVSEAWARTIARTEVVGAANAGSFHQATMLSKAGIGPNAKRWLATTDARTRPTHAAANGQLVALTDTFDVGGAGLMHPGDPLGPASETYNCRCTITYETIETPTSKPFVFEDLDDEDGYDDDDDDDFDDDNDDDDGGFIPTSKPFVPTSKPFVFDDFDDGSGFRQFDEQADANRWEDEHWNKWLEGLSPEESRAIAHYTGKGYTNMNNGLRGLEELSSRSKDEIARLDAALSRARVPENIRVTRAFDSNGPVGEGLRSGRIKVGDTLTDPGYMSTTTLPQFEQGEGDVWFEIDVPEGTYGGYVPKVSTFQDENELLLQRGSTMEITSMFVDEDNNILVSAKIVNQEAINVG